MVNLCYFVFEIATQPERIVNLFYILYQTATQIRQNGEPMLYCSSNCNKTWIKRWIYDTFYMKLKWNMKKVNSCYMCYMLHEKTYLYIFS